MIRYFMTFLLLFATLSPPLSAQEEDRMKKLEKEVEELKKTVEEQKRFYDTQIKDLQDEIAKLEREKKTLYSSQQKGGEPKMTQGEKQSYGEQIQALQDKIKELEEKQRTAEETYLSRPKERPTQAISLGAFNPAITAFGDMMANVSSRHQFGPAGDEVGNRAFMRSGELDIRAPIDPFADAVSIITFEENGKGDFEPDVEEGYVNLKKLPGVDEMPLGLKFQLGKFRAPFGFINKVHMHDSPWTMIPLPVALYLGQESLGRFGEGGFHPIGGDAQLLLPSFTKESSLTLDTGVYGGGHYAQFAQNNGSNNPVFINHLSWWSNPTETTDLVLGLSSYNGRSDRHGSLSANLYGADFIYKWKPFEKGEWKSFIFGGEVFRGKTADALGDNVNPFGYYLYAQYQFDKPWYIGLRYDYANKDPNNIGNIDFRGKVIAAYVSYYTTEFLRFRVGLEREFSHDLTSSNTILFELTWVFGSHPTEPWWVNK